MKCQNTSTLFLAAMFISASPFVGVLTASEPEKKGAPKPLPANVARAWRDAGAEVGWMKCVPPEESTYRFWNPWRDKAETEAMPAFRFPQRDAKGILANLPDPGMPFGLDFHRGFFAGVRLKELAGLSNLQSLNYGGIEGKHEDLHELARFKNLRGLYLFYLPVTDADLKHLAGLKHLQVLDLSHTEVTGAGLNELAGLKSLQALNLFATRIRDADLKELAALKNLQWLNLQGTEVTAAGAAALQKDLPDCKIIARESSKD